VPLILARIYEEDIDFKKGVTTSKFKTSPLSTQKHETSDAEKLIENLSANIDHRNKSARLSINKDNEILNHSFKCEKEEKKSVPLDGDFTFDDILLQKDGSNSNRLSQ